MSFTVGNRGRHTASARFLNARLVLTNRTLSPWHGLPARTCFQCLRYAKGPDEFEVTIGEPIKLKENGNGGADYAAAMQDYADSDPLRSSRSGAMARLALRTPAEVRP